MVASYKISKSAMALRAILTDIESTTRSIHFVHQVFFPFSATALPEFVRTRALEWHSGKRGSIESNEPKALH